MKGGFTIGLILFAGLQMLAAEVRYPYTYATKAEPGEGVISLLRRYALEQEKCNFDAFYSLNEMEEGAPLYTHRNYTLPITIYKYNHKSIRSTIGKDDWDLASAIAAYNRDLIRKGIRVSTYMESGILWVPYHLLECEGVMQPVEENRPVAIAKKASVKTINVPAFGEREARVEIKSEDLKDQVFYIISGHGGPDPGAIGSCNHSHSALCEDEYAYDVSLRLARRLIENSATVHLIIEDPDDGIRDEEILKGDHDELCMGKKIPLNQLARLRQRTEAVNSLYKKYRATGKKKQVAIAIHVDSRAPNKRQDVFFYHFDKSRSGRQLAYDIHGVFSDKYRIHRASGEYHGYVTSRNLYVLKNTMPTAVYVELANIRNPVDQIRIKKASNRAALADWLFEGLTLRK